MVIVMGEDREGVGEKCLNEVDGVLPGESGCGRPKEEEGKPSGAGGWRELVGAKDELCWYKSARF